MRLPPIKPAGRKDLGEISREWDRLAQLRYAQIESGRDFSYSRILEPTIIQLLQQQEFSSVLDVGCGVGILTHRLGELCDRVLGLDISETSISIARQHNSRADVVDFVTESIEAFATEGTEKFDVVIANMMLMSTPDLDSALNAMVEALTPCGRLIITITHPWFWPKYWGYETAAWFVYGKEIVLDAPFAISSDGPSPFVITHIHRPLESYVKSLVNSKMCVTNLIEPSPPDDAPDEYRQHWEFPRFLAITCVKRSAVAGLRERQR